MKKLLISSLTFWIMLSNSFAQDISMTKWRMHEGNEKIISQALSHHGDEKAYEFMGIPDFNDTGWKEAPNDKGMIKFGGGTASKITRELQQIDFTYFETILDVPQNTSINKLEISFGQVDDGARAYIFNSKYPNGAYKEQIKLYEKPVTEDYKDFVVRGERNRIVIVQFDDAAKGNNLKDAEVKVNGKPLKVQISPWRMHEGNENIILQDLSHHGDQKAYEFMNIPTKNDSKWEPAPLDDKMAISFGGRTASNIKQPLKQIDFTYFDTFINIPEGVTIEEFQVSFGQVDDGARAYVFNSKYPDGIYKGQIKLDEKPATEDYKSFLISGENRIVIVQFDDAPKGNNLKNAQIKLRY